MVDGAGRLDELLGPRQRFGVFDTIAEQGRVQNDWGGYVEIAVFGGPPERGAQISQLVGKPYVGITLTRTVPQGEDVCFASGKIAGMRSPRISRLATSGKLLL